MKFISPPKHDALIEASEAEMKTLVEQHKALVIPHREAHFVLISGSWIMILPPDDTPTSVGQPPRYPEATVKQIHQTEAAGKVTHRK